MTLDVITNKIEIKNLHKQFADLMKQNSISKPGKLEFSSPGGNGDALVYTYSDGNFWWASPTLSKEYKNYNLFGVDPNFKKSNTILFQINYLKEFDGYNEGALWAKDVSGRTFLLHTGKMGGGIPGITIENIDRLYSGKKVLAYHSDNEKDCFVICDINSHRAFSQVIAFAKQIKRIKEILKATNSYPEAKKTMLLKKYNPEFWGKRKSYFLKGKIESECDHGIIVDSLKQELASNYGHSNCVSNSFVDLGISKKNKPIAIFEVKTSIASQSIYTAVGQLMLHSNSLRSNPKKYAVLPNEFDKNTENDLKLLGIETIRYKWKKNKVQFLNLNLLYHAR